VLAEINKGIRPLCKKHDSISAQSIMHTQQRKERKWMQNTQREKTEHNEVSTACNQTAIKLGLDVSGRQTGAKHVLHAKTANRRKLSRNARSKSTKLHVQTNPKFAKTAQNEPTNLKEIMKHITANNSRISRPQAECVVMAAQGGQLGRF